MGEKDMSEKILEDYNDVFSDIVNVLLFHGQELIEPSALESIIRLLAWVSTLIFREIFLQ